MAVELDGACAKRPDATAEKANKSAVRYLSTCPFYSGVYDLGPIALLGRSYYDVD